MTSAPSLKTYSMFGMLDRTFRVYRDNLLNCVIILAGVSIPISIVNYILSTSSLQKLSSVNTVDPSSLSSADFNTVCLSSVITIVLAIVQAVLTNGPISYIASESIFGRKVTLMEAFQARQARLTTLGWGLTQFYFALGAFAFAIAIIGTLCAPVLALLGSLVYVGVAVYALIVPVLMLENVRPSFGITRAWSLGKSRFWTVAGLLLAITLISTLINWAVVTVAALILNQQLSSASALAQDAITTAVATISNVFLLPLLPIAMTLLYYDTRLRSEGLQDALLATNKPDARPSDIESPLPQPRLNQTDYRNMVIVIVVTLLVALLAGTLLAPVINQMMPGLAIQ